MKTTEILDVLRRQHSAIDQLMAKCAATDRTFYPTKSGALWDAVVLGHNAICILEAEVRGEPTFVCPACHRVSYHPKDIEYGYCGFCHDFTGKRPEEVKP
jgi:hypothetical protein